MRGLNGNDKGFQCATCDFFMSFGTAYKKIKIHLDLCEARERMIMKALKP
jgi:hypothetical protein